MESKLKNLLSIPELAEFTGVKERTIILEIKRGKLKAKKVFAKHFVKVEDFEAYVENYGEIDKED